MQVKWEWEILKLLMSNEYLMYMLYMSTIQISKQVGCTGLPTFQTKFAEYSQKFTKLFYFICKADNEKEISKSFEVK